MPSGLSSCGRKCLSRPAECGRQANTDHVSVLVVKRFGLGVLLAAYFPDYQRDGRDGSELWSGIVPQWVEVDGVKGIAGVVDEELFS